MFGASTRVRLSVFARGEGGAGEGLERQLGGCGPSRRRGARRSPTQPGERGGFEASCSLPLPRFVERTGSPGLHFALFAFVAAHGTAQTLGSGSVPELHHNLLGQK